MKARPGSIMNSPRTLFQNSASLGAVAVACRTAAKEACTRAPAISASAAVASDEVATFRRNDRRETPVESG